MPITHQVFNLVSSDGSALKGRFWKPKNHPIATICLIHGIGEHSGRYDFWARRFCKQGIMVYALDYRGHGMSAGKQGHINQLSDFLDDIGALVRRCKRNHRDIPSYIYGHSMGGNLVLSYLIKRRQDFYGAIITSPWLGLIKPPSPLKLKAAKLINHIYPAFSTSTGIKSNRLSSLEKNQQLADKDPFMHGRITIRTFFELSKSAKSIMANSARISIPMIICHGESDNVTRCDLSEKLAASNPKLCSFISYPNALHELHNEPVSDQLFNDILSWILLHNAKKTT